MENNTSEQNPQDKVKLSRRQFLKLGGAAVTAAVVIQAAGSGSGQPASPERLMPLNEQVLMIDFAPESREVGLQQEQFPDNELWLKKILKDKYVSLVDVVRKYGRLFNPKKQDEPDSLEQRFFTDNPRAAMVLGALNTMKDHGAKVAKVMGSTWRANGFWGEPTIIPLQGLVAEPDITFRQDRLGNQGFYLSIEPKPIIEALRGSRQRVVNFSFQMGEVGFDAVQRREELDRNFDLSISLARIDSMGNETYVIDSIAPPSVTMIVDGQPRYYVNNKEVTPITAQEAERLYFDKVKAATKIVESPTAFIRTRGAYGKENAERNLGKLFEVCRAYPDKLFVVACGNYSDDITDAREKLATEWPNNLIITAPWRHDMNRPESEVNGADIYVDDSRLPGGSSFSTPVVTALTAIFLNRGLTIEETKSKIYAMCRIEQYPDPVYSQSNFLGARVLDTTTVPQ